MSQELKIEVRACDSAESCIEGADIAVVATNTTGKGDGIAFRGGWARAGMHVNAIGSTMPKLREIDSAEFCLCRVDSNRLPDQDKLKRNRATSSTRWLTANTIAAKLLNYRMLPPGAPPGRDSRPNRLRCSSPSARQSRTWLSGYAVYQEARRLGVGSEVSDFLELKTF